MSQFDFGTIDPNSKSGAQLALDLNKFRDALNSGHKGSVRPSYAQAGMLWVRETSSTQWDLMFFDGDTDFVLRSVNPTTNALLGIPQSQIEDLSATLSKYVGKDSATGAATLPSGTTAQRPAAPVPGMLRYNSSLGRFERRSATAWLDYGQMDGPFNEAAVQTIDVSVITNIHLYNNTLNITGSGTITSLGSGGDSGIVRRLVFTTVLQITHNATSLILPGAANITTAAGDVAEFVSLGSGNWRCLGYQRANGTALVGVGQTWQDVTGSRAIGVTYTNTTGRPIQILVLAGGQLNTNKSITLNGVSLGMWNLSGSGSASNSSVSAVIPEGGTYLIGGTAAGLVSWSELR